MKKFRVWDELNEDREDATEVEDFSVIDAAKSYAEDDTDGHTDGVYLHRNNPVHDLHRNGHPLIVEDADGNRTRYHVGVVEFSPVYGAVPVEREEQGQ